MDIPKSNPDNSHIELINLFSIKDIITEQKRDPESIKKWVTDLKLPENLQIMNMRTGLKNFSYPMIPSIILTRKTRNR
jgi:hypothetical protein